MAFFQNDNQARWQLKAATPVAITGMSYTRVPFHVLEYKVHR